MVVDKILLERLILQGLDKLVNEKQVRELGLPEIEKRIAHATGVEPLPFTIWTEFVPTMEHIPSIEHLNVYRGRLVPACTHFKEAINLIYPELFEAAEQSIDTFLDQVRDAAAAGAQLDNLIPVCYGALLVGVEQLEPKSLMMINISMAAVILGLYKILDTYELYRKSSTRR